MLMVQLLQQALLVV